MSFSLDQRTSNAALKPAPTSTIPQATAQAAAQATAQATTQSSNDSSNDADNYMPYEYANVYK